MWQALAALATVGRTVPHSTLLSGLTYTRSDDRSGQLGSVPAGGRQGRLCRAAYVHPTSGTDLFVCAPRGSNSEQGCNNCSTVPQYTKSVRRVVP